MDIISAIVSINPDAQVTVNGNDYDKIIWGETEVISKVDIQAKVEELKSAYNVLEYRRKRKAEYPSIEDVMVALAEKEEGNSAMWDEISVKRQSIKLKYPKS